MKIKKHQLLNIASTFFIFTLFTTGCGEVQKVEEIAQDEKIVTETTTLFSIDNKLFYIPNPIQSALLMKKIAVPYNKEILNPVGNVENYSTSFKQAVNIGILGADLGYITANNQNQDAITYLGAIKKISDELSISSAFDFSTMEKFGNNIGNQQEMLTLLTTAYKNCEEYLQKDERKDIAGLMMAGAIIEGLYFASCIVKESANQEVINRIGEQKQSIDNIIHILNPFYSKENSPEFSDFVDQLVDLQTDFQGVHSEYTFVKTTCDESNKICTINSKNEIIMSNNKLQSLTIKIKKIREQLIS
ncbi:MAG: hypothetical protein ABII90_01135 [Bacteroidota bacterium]